MSDETKIKYLFINMKLRHYLVMQLIIIGFLLAASAVLFAKFGNHEVEALRYLWVVCFGIGVLEGLETAWAVKKARSK